MEVEYLIGLDLGQAHDYSALAVLERRPPQAGGQLRPQAVYAVRHLRRFPLGMPYPAVVDAVVDLLAPGRLPGCGALVVDHTGVGRAVVDLLRDRAPPIALVPVTITAGRRVTVAKDGSLRVPKKELVRCVQVLLEGRQLKLPRDLVEAEALVRELASFRVRITASAHETFGVWREGEHDDLVLAVALACWQAQRHGPQGPKIQCDAGRGGARHLDGSTPGTGA